MLTDEISPNNVTPVFTVTEIVALLQTMLNELPQVRVTGEISNLMVPRSGHWYFSLKDESASIRCAFFKNSQFGNQFKAVDGAAIELCAEVAIYPARGDLQLIVKSINPLGDGSLQEAFDKLKQKLLKEGLFSAEIKKDIPTNVKTVGIITSSTGAALRDILSTLQKREPWLDIIIYPTLVQGEAATNNIIEAIQIANQRKECDVLILARGGGSLEDLFAFNQESVARAIHASEIPIVCGVGHETDTTIADWVADARAPTPTAAAVLVSRPFSEHKTQLEHAVSHLFKQIKTKMQWQNLSLDHLKSRIRSPKESYRLITERVTHLAAKLNNALGQQLHTQKNTFLTWIQKLKAQHPNQLIKESRHQVNDCYKLILNQSKQNLQQQQTKFQKLVLKLDTLSPLSILGRGYSLLEDENRHILDSVHQIHPGKMVTIRLKDGNANAKIHETHPHE